LKINRAEYIQSAVRKEDYPKLNLPHITFAGRSNVGKSTLINTIVGKKNLAKTSSSPGKTRTLNFYLINKKFYFVDLPGYGYAKVPKPIRQQWKNMITEYYEAAEKIISSFIILDARREISPLDIQMLDWFNYYKIETILIINKIDKLKKGELPRRKRAIIDKLAWVDNNKVVLFSAKTGKGKKEILKHIEQSIRRFEKA